eukprot:271052-Rhodomonas_salina.1
MSSESAANVLGMGFGDLDVSVEWPDDAFMSLVCVSKDTVATAVSVLTSTINSFVQTALGMPLAYNAAGGAQVDSNLRAVLSMTMASVNNLLFQMALLPLYLPIVVQKVVLCTSNSLLAFTDVLGLSVTIGDAAIQAASGAALGQCLPERTTADVGTIRSTGALDAIGMVAGELLETVQQSAGNLVLSGISTSGDAVLSYIGGVISGMQDVTQT